MALFSVMGDSISTFEGISPSDWRMFYDQEQQERHGVLNPCETWWGRVIDHFGGELLRDSAFSGCCTEGRGFPAGESLERAQYLCTSEQSPDHVLVFQGTNDYGWGNALNQAMCGSLSAPKEWAAQVKPATPHIPGTACPEDLDIFADGYERMVRNIRACCPNATVWCMTVLPGRLAGVGHTTFPYQYRGNKLEDFNAALARGAKAAGGVVCDAAGLGYEYEGLDGTHPTALGMKQMAALFIHVMEIADTDGLLPAAEPFDWDAAKQELFEGFEQEPDHCDRPNCMGCEFAQATGFPWTTVCQK